MPLVRKTTGAAPPPPPPITAAQLLSGTREERWAAARTLADVPALGRALAQEEDATVREAILTSLCRIATPDAVAAIVPGVRSDDAQVRRSALDALISMPAAAAPHLGALLADNDPDVRLLSCEVVRALPAEKATSLLCDLLRTEREVNVCASAVDVLTEVGTADALPALHALSARFPGEPFLQFAAQAAIERIAESGRD
jgi:HEAT repeat protein